MIYKELVVPYVSRIPRLPLILPTLLLSHAEWRASDEQSSEHPMNHLVDEGL